MNGTYLELSLYNIKPDSNIRYLFKITKSYYHLGEKKFIVDYVSTPSRKVSDWLHKFDMTFDIKSVEYIDTVKEIQ